MTTENDYLNPYDRVEVGVWPAAVPEDGEHEDTIVVQIDTSVDTGRLRVNVNDGTIWDGDPEKVDSPEVKLLVQTFRRLERLEAAAIQLGYDLGSLRGDLATRARELGLKL